MPLWALQIPHRYPTVLKTKTFIYKPCGGARGEGIHLTQDAGEVPLDESLLVQECVQSLQVYRACRHMM